MNRIILDVTNLLSSAIGSEGLQDTVLDRTAASLYPCVRRLADSPLPFMTMPSSRFQFSEMKALVGSMTGKPVKNVVILGIGGSALGTQTIFGALLHPFHNSNAKVREKKPRFFVLDNIDPATICAVLDQMRDERDETIVVVISKSGETPETLSQFMIFKEFLSQMPDYRERVVFITDREKGLLNRIAVTEGYRVFNVPDGVGGRFSVLTPVGMLPSLFLGIDVDAIMDGAAEMALHVRENSHLRNIAMVLASALYLMDLQGKHLHVMMPYCDRLALFADWFRQLEAESLGKQGKGATPVKAVGVTDQHSQLQLYMEGPRDKCILFMSASSPSLTIPPTLDYLEEVDYLKSKDLRDLFEAELQGTILALTKVKVPSMRIGLRELDAFSLGALFFLFEMAVAFMGELYAINAFDQPGVELGKTYTKAIMGKKGLEGERKAVESLLSGEKTIITF